LCVPLQIVSHELRFFSTCILALKTFYMLCATAGLEDPFELDSSLLLSSGRHGEDRKRQYFCTTMKHRYLAIWLTYCTVVLPSLFCLKKHLLRMPLFIISLIIKVFKRKSLDRLNTSIVLIFELILRSWL